MKIILPYFSSYIFPFSILLSISRSYKNIAWCFHAITKVQRYSAFRQGYCIQLRFMQYPCLHAEYLFTIGYCIQAPCNIYYNSSQVLVFARRKFKISKHYCIVKRDIHARIFMHGYSGTE